MPDSPETSPWLCHICNRKGSGSEGQACSECYKMTCPRHRQMTTVLNQVTGLYELKLVCSECRLRAQL